VSNKKKKLKKPSVKPAPTFQIEKVRWKDHFSSNYGWHDLDDLETKPRICVTVGIVVAEDAETVTLGQDMTENLRVSSTTTVLKACIVDRINLGEIIYAKKD
jgi:hypothetical protein